jgi:GNAT superfamily N-acetyltransferase
MTNQNSNLSIRKATQHDIAVIRNIAHQTWPVAYKDILTPEALNYMLEFFYSEEALLQQMNDGQLFFIADLSNTAIGFGSVSSYDPATFKLNKLYVLPGIQKTGAGKALMNYAVDLARSQAASSFILNVNRFNSARFFYEKRGFKVLKEENVDLGNGIVQEDFLMGINIAQYQY